MRFNSLSECIRKYRDYLLKCGVVVKTEDWQGLQDGFNFLELQSIDAIAPMCDNLDDLRKECNPFLPWADDHFSERVCGEPLNPPPSHKYWLKGNEKFMSGEQFSHSYPERFWPSTLMPKGIRYRTGDLNDLIELLLKNPTSRQAYLPIYFPEDLGASAQNERVPCTLGYHVFIRNNKLNIFYPMRSCDAIRHFHNDLYMCNRLGLYILDILNTKYNFRIGYIHFSCSSFHCFENDRFALEKLVRIN